ncbi:AMP-binding protein [candidate division KSB1 bacterium]|nr:AMP-binding protein [candidate division KSB1 bacterium]
MSKFHELLNRSFEKNKTNHVIIYKDQGYTYARIQEAIQRFSQGLKQLGINKGDRVVLLLPNFVQFPICYFGILKIGAVVAPLNFLNSEAQIKAQIQIIQPKIIIVWQNLLAKVQAFQNDSNIKMVVLGERVTPPYLDLTRLIVNSAPLNTTCEINEDDTAVIQFTGGETGAPRGVELSYEAITSNCQAFREAFFINSSETFIAILPFFLPISQTAILNAVFLAGAKMVICPNFELNLVSSLINTHQVTVLLASASFYRTLITSEVPNEALTSLKYCLVYGENLRPDLAAAFENKFHRQLFASYGLSEATALVTCDRIDGERLPGSVGLPLDHVYIKIVNDAGETLTEDKIGEIVVHAPSLMKGYVGQAEETARVLRDGWLYTNDLGKLDHQGYLYVLERRSNVIIKGGFLVFPHEIENFIANHPKVREVAVIGVPDGIQGHAIKACIVPHDTVTLDQIEIITYCQHGLEVYKCPKFVQIYRSLPKSPTGRILKSKLRENST